jgi:hypothetical protein
MSAVAARTTPFQALYRACIKEAAGRNEELIHAILARALEELPRQAAREADPAERNLLADAAKALDARHRLLCEAYPQAVLAEMSQAIAGERAQGMSFDSLPLLGEEQLQENVDIARVTESVVAVARSPLAELESLLAATHGTPYAHPQRHPLRPEVYVRGLLRIVNQIPATADIRRRWLRFMGMALGPELGRIYAQLSAMLRRQGVVATVGQAAPATEEASVQLSVRELRRLLAGELEPAAPTGARPAFQETEFSATVPAAFETLREMRQVDQVIQQLRQRQAARPTERSESRHEFRETMKLQVRRPAQALALEVVKLMIDNLAKDPRLLEPVQEAIRELEPSLLRLALADPRFFSDRAHPARQLLEQVTQRSLAWTQVDAPGFADFFDAFQQAVEALLEARATGPEPFAIALETLTEAWSDAMPRSRRTREKAVRALLRAEQRNLLAERIAGQLCERPEAVGAPQQLVEFLRGPWAQVMAHARLADNSGAEDPGSYGAAAATLLRSVRPPLAARLYPHRQPLAERIRHGLASIDYLPADAQRWLATFDALQERAVNASLGAMPEQPPHTAGDTWLAPLEVHESGFVPHPESLSDTGSSLEQGLPAVDLKPGAWVELQGQDAWERWQLTWSSPHGLLFMFMQGVGRTQSMTRSRLQQLLATGGLRLVSSEAVVDGALDAVAQAAWRNTDY